MKRVLSLLISLALMLALTACGSAGSDPTNAPVPQESETADFVPPEDYASVVLVSTLPLSVSF